MLPSNQDLPKSCSASTSGFTLHNHLSEPHLYSRRLLKLVMFVSNKEATTSPRLRQRGHIQQRICLSPTTGSREELSQPVNMRAQQADHHLQRGACRGQHQLHPGHCQRVLMGECFPLDVQHPMEANKDLVAENTGGEVLANLPTETTRHISTVLANMHPMVQQQFQTDFQYYGTKTVERLRGNSTIWSWISINYDQHNEDYVNKTTMPTVINISNKKRRNLSGKRLKTMRATWADRNGDSVWSLNNKMKMLR